MKDYISGPRFVLTLSDGVLVTADQLAKISKILSGGDRLVNKYVGTTVSSSGYIKELQPLEINDTVQLKFLPEDDYTAYRFLAAQTKEAA